MILKRNLDPVKVGSYVWRDLALGAVSAAAAAIAFDGLRLTSLALPVGLLPVLGTALAIFLAFRNNAAWNRWNEASQLWAAITASSRVFGRLIIIYVDAHRHTPQYNAALAPTYQREMVYRHLAWVNALRLQLRRQDSWGELEPYLSPEEFAMVRTKQHKASYLLFRQGQRVYDGMAVGMLQGFDPFQLENCMALLSSQQGQCERIKAIPVLRPYDYFTRVFTAIFIVLLPFSLVGALAASGATWLLLPLTVIITFVFSVTKTVAVANEEPFENRTSDVPLSAFCRQIERDLREMLGEAELPPALEPKEGYLW